MSLNRQIHVKCSNACNAPAEILALSMLKCLVSLYPLQVYLDTNVTAYAEYFEWKSHFKVTLDVNRAFCQLCEALNSPQRYPPKIAENLNDWWREQAGPNVIILLTAVIVCL